MTRIIIIAVTALVAFGGGFLGILATMPNIAPEKVAEVDSLAAPVEVVVDLPVAPPDTTQIIQAPLPEERVGVLEDSLSTALAEIGELRSQLLSAQKSRASAESYASSLAELSATLPKLEPEELGAILERLDIVALEKLYQAATARNRTLILQALSPEMAARFVQRIVSPSSPPPSPLDQP